MPGLLGERADEVHIVGDEDERALVAQATGLGGQEVEARRGGWRSRRWMDGAHDDGPRLRSSSNIVD